VIFPYITTSATLYDSIRAALLYLICYVHWSDHIRSPIRSALIRSATLSDQIRPISDPICVLNQSSIHSPIHSNPLWSDLNREDPLFCILSDPYPIRSLVSATLSEPIWSALLYLVWSDRRRDRIASEIGLIKLKNVATLFDLIRPISNAIPSPIRFLIRFSIRSTLQSALTRSARLSDPISDPLHSLIRSKPRRSALWSALLYLIWSLSDPFSYIHYALQTNLIWAATLCDPIRSALLYPNHSPSALLWSVLISNQSQCDPIQYLIRSKTFSDRMN